MNCNTCHPVGSIDDPTNADQLRETYGFGNGQMLAVDDEGTTHDLTAYLDENGDLTSTFAHPNTGPIPAEIRDHALSILVTPQIR